MTVNPAKVAVDSGEPRDLYSHLIHGFLAEGVAHCEVYRYCGELSNGPGDPDAPIGRGNFEREGRPIAKYRDALLELCKNG